MACSVSKNSNSTASLRGKQCIYSANVNVNLMAKSDICIEIGISINDFGASPKI